MKQSNTGFTGNSTGSLGGASQEDLRRGYSTVKDEEEDDLDLSLRRMLGKFGPYGDFEPEPDASIDREDGKNWE